MDGLLRRATLPVDSGGRDPFRVAGGEHRSAGDIGALLADLADTPSDHIVDHPGVDPGALDQRGERVGEQVNRMKSGKGAGRSPLAERSAHRVNDDGVRHHNLLQRRPSTMFLTLPPEPVHFVRGSAGRGARPGSASAS